MSQIAFVGTYTTDTSSQGIYALRFRAETCSFEMIGCVAKTVNPSYVCIDPKRHTLYAVNETTLSSGEEGSVLSYRVDGDTGELSLLGKVGTRGVGPCYLSLDQTRRTLLVANFHSGSIAAISLKHDGNLEEVASYVQLHGRSVHPERQRSSHPHAIIPTPDNRFVLVTDLGADELRIFAFDEHTRLLAETSSRVLKFEPGSGPRHMAVHPNHRFLYVVHEISSQVTVHALGEDGRVSPSLQKVSTHSAAHIQIADAAGIVTDSAGTMLYTCTRQTSSIATFHIDPQTGLLERMSDVSAGGSSPREILVTGNPALLIAVNNRSNNLTLFKRLISGHLLIQHPIPLDGPACIAFYD